MLCFTKKPFQQERRELPPGLNFDKLFPSYTLSKFPNSTKKTVTGTKIIVSRKKLENDNYTHAKNYPWIKTISFKLIVPKEKKYFCIKINNRNCKDPDQIVVFSNGETSNICGMIPILVDLSSYLRINIIAYEYPEMKDNLTLYEKEQEMLKATLTVISYTYALERNKKIILMGYSTGVYLNYKVIELLIHKSKLFRSKLKHIINISPMWCFDSSFSKKIFHNRKYSSFISNLVKISNLKLKVSTFISHGVKDNQIGYMISMKICSRINFIYEWYPKEGDHYNIILNDIYRRKLFSRLKKFLSVDNSIYKDDIDGLIISKIANEGININIMKDPNKSISGNGNSFSKDMNISSGNFFFGSDKKNNISNINNFNNISFTNININNTEEKSGSKNKKNNIMINECSNSIIQDRKESGFSFLDISLQKMNPNFGENIDEIKDEEISDDEELNEEQNKKNKIENFVGQLNPEENIVNIDDEFDNNTNNENNKVINNINIINTINIINNKIINNKEESKDNNNNGMINIVSSIIKGSNEILNESDGKLKETGCLINDSFGKNNNAEKTTSEISFTKGEN